MSSNVFLNVEGIGNVYIKEVFVEYDHPLIFVCEDEYDSLYLFHETDDTSEQLVWQAVKISRQTYHNMLANRISLLHVFKEQQPTRYLLIKYRYGELSAQVEESRDVQCKEILDCEETFVSDFRHEDTDELDLHIAEDSSMLEIELYPGQAVDRISADIMRTICSAFESIAKNMWTSNKSIRIEVGMAKAASYAIPIVITSSTHSLSAAKAVKDMVTVISSPAGNDSLMDKNQAVLSSMKSLYTKFEETRSDFVLTYFDEDLKEKVPKRVSRSECSSGKKKIESALGEIKKMDETDSEVNALSITGALVALNVKDGTFKFKCSSEGKEYSGEIAPELKKTSSTVGSDTSYEATIQDNGKRCILQSLNSIHQNTLFQ